MIMYCRSLIFMSFILLFPACDWIQLKKSPSFIVVNVLDTSFYNDCHIKGSIQVTFADLETYAHTHWDKEKTEVILYCGNYKCTASGAGAKMLRDQGFKKAYAFEGGTAEWVHKGYPVTGPCQEKYLEDFEEPADFSEKLKKEGELIIIADDLYTKMRNFGLLE